MIIIASRPGQLGNMLIVYSAFLALSLEYGVKVVNPAFSKYRQYFRKQKKLQIFMADLAFRLSYIQARLLARTKLNSRLARATCLDWQETVELGQRVNEFSSPIFHFVQGWNFRANDLLKKHATEIRRVFTPRRFYQARILDFMTSHFRDGELLVGIHIRRGDYSRFENGRFFYSPQQYVTLMQNIRSMLGSEQVSFLVCSNERIDPALFPADMKVVQGPAHELLDMYCLARCHMIAGPPSTYTMWASFFGETPLYMVRDCSAMPQRSDFVIQDSF